MHPENKYHRFLISLKKAKKRVETWFDWTDMEYQKKQLQAHRNTTKLCSCPGCRNENEFGHPQDVRSKEDMKDQLKDAGMT